MQVSVKDNIAQVLARMRMYKQDVVDKAVPRALNRTADQARTAIGRELRAEGYNLSAAEIKSAIATIRASKGRLVAQLRVGRKTKSLISFDAKETKDGVRVKVHGPAKLIKGAFIAQRLNGVSGVYVEDKSAGKIVIRRQKQYKKGSRGGWHDYPARKLYGPSVGGVYANERIQATMMRVIAELFTARLEHEIKYLSR
jgi:hypothetical protein